MAPATAGKAVSRKRKLESSADAGNAMAEGPLQEAPMGQLQGHSQCVSGVVWPDQDSIYSGSWDYSVNPSVLHYPQVYCCYFFWCCIGVTMHQGSFSRASELCSSCKKLIQIFCCMHH